MQQALELNALREDLRLYESGSDSEGAPIWAIQDPVTNRFYRIGWLEYECLLRWPNEPQQIADEINATTPLRVDAEQVADFAQFLEMHQLIRPTQRTRERMLKQAHEPGWRHWKWWLQNYLFVRVPILRPQRWLQAAMPLVSPLFTFWAFALVVMASCLGIVLVARQWDTFTHAVTDMLTPAGMLGFVIALIVSKTLHELGHAFVATRYGVRVAHMGVAFLVMWPMLYTDTGESWRLKSHRQRLAISAAGVTTELALAGLATLAWALLDDGTLRQAMLYLATTGWVLSLALNVSPFMRFDGYFILSDILDFPNLHERAGAAARVWVRRALLGFEDAYLEEYSTRQRRALVAFALVTWLYRFIVFLGIAVMVYLLFFKLLGIFLMVVEVIWFIGRPIWSEVSVWLKRRQEIKPSRRFMLLAFFAGLLLLLTIPWKVEVQGVGVAHPQRVQTVYAPFPAQMQSLHASGAIEQGAVLVSFTEPELFARSSRSDATLYALNKRLDGLMAEAEGSDARLSIRSRMQEQLTELASIEEERGRLAIIANFPGLWLDVDPYLSAGAWVNSREPVGVLVDPQSWVIDAYVEQRVVERLEVGRPARFYIDNQMGYVSAVVDSIDSTQSRYLPFNMLATRHGGSIAVVEAEEQTKPSEALYRVRLRLNEPLPVLQEQRGRVYIEGARRSMLVEAGKSLMAILIRESGF
ncbi:MAG: peptidase M50 [Thiopseudomonas sp.]|nr:peptidase M50 [Thiopseudomonas sp.]MCK9465495.1 peptidase M50 [Thiopseudomonas sp.]